MRPARLALWPSPLGIVVLLGLCALAALSAVLGWLSFALVLGAGAALALFVGDLRSGPRSSDIAVARRLLAHAVIGRACDIEYTITNRSGSSVRAQIFEGWQPAVSFDRDEEFVDVPARTHLTVHRSFLPRRRGRIELLGVFARIDNRIGLLRRRFSADVPLEANVLPDFSATDGYGKIARRFALVEAGLRKIRMRGAGTEFESLRDYADGDAFRRIDWKATARRGRLTVAQFDVERSQNVLVALDAGRVMTAPLDGMRKFDYALTAGLSVARVAQTAGDNVGLIAFAADTLLEVVPRRGVAHAAALIAAASGLSPRMEEPDYDAFAARVRKRAQRRSLVVLFTDLFDPVVSEQIVRSIGLLVPRHVVLCVLMNDAAVTAALATEPRTARDAYRAAAALRLEDERSGAIASLRARGIIVVDVPAQRLTVTLLDAYLDVKARGVL